MGITREQLAKALERMEIIVDLLGSPVAGAWERATVRYPDSLADALFDRITDKYPESGGDPTPGSNREEAKQALDASTYQRQDWGEGRGHPDDFRCAQWEMGRAQAHALLDVADAIRDQTAATRPRDAASLTASDSAKCTEIVGDEEDEDGLHECGKLSRYVVERSDGDKSYGSGGGTEEACEEHLSDVVVGMVDGDERIRAVVSIRWTA